MLVDWTAATKLSGVNKIPYVSDRWPGVYPVEVHRSMYGEPTDIYMAARSIQLLVDRTLDGKMPRSFANILEYCTAASPYSRPQDAWAVQAEWKRVARDIYGPPAFREMRRKVSQ